MAVGGFGLTYGVLARQAGFSAAAVIVLSLTTFADGRALVLNARAAGLAAALVAVALRAPVLVVILAAASTAGGLRAIS